MSWNIAPECVSTVMLCIIWVYSRKGSPSPTLKNRLFQACFLMTFCGMVSNILATFLLATLGPGTLLLAWVVNTVYFITTPLMGMVYFMYVTANLFEDLKKPARVYAISAVPGLIYVVMVLLNPFNHSLFDITLAQGYIQGPLRMVTYVVFYLYCAACFLMVLLCGKRVQRSVLVILYVFPMIAALVVVVQLWAPTIILSGSAATSALLLIYLYLQNKQISIDYLTGLPNRQEFLSMLELKLKDRRCTPFSVLVLSMKNFKQVNDNWGQLCGDRLLVAVGDFLRHVFSLREGQMYRYSGDEFAILLDGEDRERITDIAATVAARLGEPWQVQGVTCLLEGAVGIVHYPQSASRLSGLIGGMEYAISIAKERPADSRVCFCDKAILQQARRRMQMATVLKEQLDCGGFQVYYQPIFHIPSGRFTMAEALLRLPDTSMGALCPSEFIPVAEQSGLIVELTYYVLDRVCGQLRRMLDAGLELDSVSVNFSAQQMTRPDLTERVRRIVQDNGVPFSKIKIEITESTLSEKQETVTDFIGQMHALGVSIGLDDFGTGYSNLASVIELPIDIVKMDKSLVWSATKEERFSIVVRNMTRAFCQLGKTVLAEGVETQEQSRFVEACGCTLIQGFLYAKPMPADELVAFLQQAQIQADPV